MWFSVEKSLDMAKDFNYNRHQNPSYKFCWRRFSGSSALNDTQNFAPLLSQLLKVQWSSGVSKHYM